MIGFDGASSRRRLQIRRAETTPAPPGRVVMVAVPAHRVGAPLRKPFAGYWRARRGEYRVRYTIEESNQTVQVLDISHRWDAYR